MLGGWVWDPDKAAANLAKHGVSFELAARIFEDPLSLTVPDPHSDGDRWRTLGRPVAALPTLLLVVHTTTEGDVAGGRIISARRATRHERRAYEQDR
jgi:hypothetical protein